MTEKKVLTIQSMACLGQISTSAALPILSVCGLETVVLPTALLSTHTGKEFGTAYSRELTEEMEKIAAHWRTLPISFDAVCTGYLKNEKQLALIRELFQTPLLSKAIRVIDPVMADAGKLYAGFDASYVGAMRRFCGDADYLLPNLTEASLLAGVEPNEECCDRALVQTLLQKLGELGAKHIVLKGISLRGQEQEIGIAYYDVEKNETEYYFTERLPFSCHGTGDCFAAVFTGALMNGFTPLKAVKLAADFATRSIRSTMESPGRWYGLRFESALGMLQERLEL